MNQKPYFRDVWALGPPNSNYPGAFPKGLINQIKLRWWGTKRLWLFSGSFKDGGGTTMDCKAELNPDIVGNCETLPFPDNSFDFVIADPPYSKEESKDLYNLPYVSIVKIMNEMARVCKPGGHIILLHRIIPQIHPQFNKHFKRCNIKAVVGIYTIAGMSNIRALTVWQKQGELVLEELIRKGGIL